VRTCGGPQFDSTAQAAAKAEELQTRREELRSKLGLGPHTLMILAVGQVHGTFEMASMLLEGVIHAKGAGRLPPVRACLCFLPSDANPC
jgi:hypothetical protein